jgi:hypothetical protein
MADVVRHPRAPSVASTGRHCFARTGRRCRAVCEATRLSAALQRVAAFGGRSHGGPVHTGKDRVNTVGDLAAVSIRPPRASAPLSQLSVPAWRQAWGHAGRCPARWPPVALRHRVPGGPGCAAGDSRSGGWSCCLRMCWTSRWMWPDTRYGSTRRPRRGPTTRLCTGSTGNAGSPREDLDRPRPSPWSPKHAAGAPGRDPVTH